MLNKKCNNCGFQQDRFLNIGGRNYCKSCNSIINETQQQTEKLIQLTNHQMKLTLDVLNNTMEALEEYIDKVEKSGNYPNLKTKKQLFTKSINSPNRTSDELASDFLSQLYCLKAIVNKRPDDFMKKVKGEYYR